eukprot:TRINITY_DN8420_c0_g1_i1.p1 TRINITY_DN8420_c0_g1~~TRINITY_DN8420_c0_g1_i1.p1  ORF type:complete len:831 (+),score=259.86 TRINITY_DN8420_c0_g1_i1:78-2495(+)
MPPCPPEKAGDLSGWVTEAETHLFLVERHQLQASSVAGAKRIVGGLRNYISGDSLPFRIRTRQDNLVIAKADSLESIIADLELMLDADLSDGSPPFLPPAELARIQSQAAEMTRIQAIRVACAQPGGTLLRDSPDGKVTGNVLSKAQAQAKGQPWPEILDTDQVATVGEGELAAVWARLASGPSAGSWVLLRSPQHGAVCTAAPEHELVDLCDGMLLTQRQRKDCGLFAKCLASRVKNFGPFPPWVAHDAERSYDAGYAHKEDHAANKVLRVVSATTRAALALPFVPGGVRAVFSTVRHIERYGIYVLGGITLSDDIIKAVSVIANLMMQIQTDSSMAGKADICKGLYYLLSYRRGERGDDPLLADKEHTGAENGVRVAPAPKDVVAELMYWCPFAAFAYEKELPDVQRLARQNGYEIIGTAAACADHPCFYLLADRKGKKAMLLVRGTHSLSDSVLDALCSTVQVSLPRSGLQGAHVHKGMMRSALYIYYMTVASIHKLVQGGGYSLTLVGHSLGAGVASLLGTLLRGWFPQLRCFCYATPAVGDAAYAEHARAFVTTLVTGDDVVPRVSFHSVRSLVDVVQDPVFREQWAKDWDKDVEGFKERVKTVWAPRVRTVPAGYRYDPQRHEAVPESGHRHDTPERRSRTHSPSHTRPPGGGAEPPQLYTAGRIVHLYQCCGRWRSAEMAPTAPVLGRIELSAKMIDDHSIMVAWAALRALHALPAGTGPAWVPFSNARDCSRCHNPFTWANTSDSAAQEMRSKHHCRRCGEVVCSSCCKHRTALPEFGMAEPQRVCDGCFWHRPTCG